MSLELQLLNQENMMQGQCGVKGGVRDMTIQLLGGPDHQLLGGGLSAVSTRRDQHPTPPFCNLDVDHDDAPLRYRQVSELLCLGSPPGQAERILHQELMLVKGEEPATFS
jgi:hypothetical protein